MRIIGGDLKGRRFSPPSNIPARPTTDFAKEALFNILNNRIYFDEVSFLDLFSGTGSIGFEFFSRGCRDITSVDLSPISINFNQETSLAIGMQPYHKLIRADVLSFIKNHSASYDVIFAGPPYALAEIDEIPNMIFENNLLAPNGIFIMETSPKHNFENNFNLVDVRNYGQTHFWFFKHLNKIENPKV